MQHRTERNGTEPNRTNIICSGTCIASHRIESHRIESNRLAMAIYARTDKKMNWFKSKRTWNQSMKSMPKTLRFIYVSLFATWILTLWYSVLLSSVSVYLIFTFIAALSLICVCRGLFFFSLVAFLLLLFFLSFRRVVVGLPIDCCWSACMPQLSVSDGSILFRFEHTSMQEMNAEKTTTTTTEMTTVDSRAKTDVDTVTGASIH